MPIFKNTTVDEWYVPRDRDVVQRSFDSSWHEIARKAHARSTDICQDGDMKKWPSVVVFCPTKTENRGLLTNQKLLSWPSLGQTPCGDITTREIVYDSDTISIELTICWLTSTGRWVNDRPTDHVVSDKLIVATLLNTRTNPVCNVLICFAKILSKWSSTHRPTDGQMLTTHYHRCLHRIPTRWASN